MNARRAQDLLKHITQDKDYGVEMMTKLPLSDSIYVVSEILPSCIKKATEDNNQNDAGYFGKMLATYRPIVLEKIKAADRLWVMYCDSTGYPYEADGDMFILFDYAHHKEVQEAFTRSGFIVTLVDINKEQFQNEIAHMYRNGYKNIRFIDGKCVPFEVAREEFFEYTDFFKDDYLTNPALQFSMISFFQEFRKSASQEGRESLLKKREDAMIKNICNGEFMVPCTKDETEEEVEISHPYIDITDKVMDKKEGEQVIAIPAFTDGFELDKCYEGQHENMLYSFKELYELIEELGGSGTVINCLGESYYIPKDMMKKFIEA